MRPLVHPFIVMAIDTGQVYSDETQEQRIKLFQCQATMRGLGVKRVVGFYNGVYETAFIVATNSELDRQAAEDLGRMWDQEYVCRVNSDGSAYQVDLNEGSQVFKGYWKSVHPWAVDKMLRDGGGFTHTGGVDPKYYVVGS